MPQTTMPTSAPSPIGFEDIHRLVHNMPQMDLGLMIRARTQGLEKKLDARDIDIEAWLAGCQNNDPFKISNCLMAIFASHHDGWQEKEPDASAQIDAILRRDDPLCGFCVAAKTDLQLFDLNLASPVADATQRETMDENECVHTISYGTLAAREGIDVLCLAGLGAGARFSAALIAEALGKSSFAQSLASDEENQIISQTLLHRAPTTDPLDLLRRLGGRDIAALMGAMIAARYAQTAVVLQGPSALIAAALLHKINHSATYHCLYAAPQGDPSATAALCADIGIRRLCPVEAIEKDSASSAVLREFTRISNIYQ